MSALEDLAAEMVDYIPDRSCDCWCCAEARDAMSHGRAPNIGCTCPVLIDPGERCLCPFCTQVYETDCDGYAAENRRVWESLDIEGQARRLESRGLWP